MRELFVVAVDLHLPFVLEKERFKPRVFYFAVYFFTEARFFVESKCFWRGCVDSVAGYVGSYHAINSVFCYLSLTFICEFAINEILIIYYELADYCEWD